MKRLVLSNDCDGATVETMRQAQETFQEEYDLPFSESCWVYARSISLLGYVGLPKPDFTFLKDLIHQGKIDTLHTWGDFPFGGFTRRLIEKAYHILNKHKIRFKAWTAHGGLQDLQNLTPLGQGDLRGTPYYHLDFTKRLGILYFCRNTDIDVTTPSKQILYREGVTLFFKRFRGPPKAEAHAITLKWLPKQIELAEKSGVNDVIIYTHFYAQENKSQPKGWEPIEEFTIPEETDRCLRKLAEKRDKGKLEILTLPDLLSGCERPPFQLGE